ncbi:MAG: hypothetical protein QNJ92_16260 [Alphaproteobacteria bacterium]|nr:hypothetical protein [Alphaproteobacteria bacterium]
MEQAAANLRVFSDLSRAVEAGEARQAEVGLARADGRITERQYAALLAKVDAAVQRRIRESQGLIRVSEALDGQAVLDPEAEDDRRAVDQFWAKMSAPRPGAEAAADAEAQRWMAVDFVRRAGVVPDAIRKQLRAQLHSSDVAQVVDTAALAVALDRAGLLPDDLLTAEQRIIATKTTGLVEGGLRPAHAVSVAQTEAEAAAEAGAPISDDGFSFLDGDAMGPGRTDVEPAKWKRPTEQELRELFWWRFAAPEELVSLYRRREGEANAEWQQRIYREFIESIDSGTPLDRHAMRAAVLEILRPDNAEGLLLLQGVLPNSHLNAQPAPPEVQQQYDALRAEDADHDPLQALAGTMAMEYFVGPDGRIFRKTADLIDRHSMIWVLNLLQDRYRFDLNHSIAEFGALPEKIRRGFMLEMEGKLGIAGPGRDVGVTPGM